MPAGGVGRRADGLLAVTPYYSLPRRTIIAHFETLAAPPMPMILYDIAPRRASY